MQLFGLVAQAVLLHRHLRVAEQVLLLGQLCLGVEDLQLKVRVAQADNHVAAAHLGAFFHDELLHDAALLGAELHDGDGLHLSVDAHEIVELVALHFADAEAARVYSQRRGVVAEDDPQHEDEQRRAARDVRQVLPPYAFLLF